MSLSYKLYQHQHDPVIAARLDLPDDLAERLHYELVSQLVTAGGLADDEPTALHNAVDSRLVHLERLVMAAGAIRTELDHLATAYHNAARERYDPADPPPTTVPDEASSGRLADAVAAARSALERVTG